MLSGSPYLPPFTADNEIRRTGEGMVREQRYRALDRKKVAAKLAVFCENAKKFQPASSRSP